MPNPDVEKRAKELELLYEEVTKDCDVKQAEQCDCWLKIAKHVEKLILEARISEAQRLLQPNETNRRITALRTQLSALEEKV